MKTLPILFVMSMLMSAHGDAAEPLCPALGSLASEVMETKYAGISMRDMMAAMDSFDDSHIAKILIIRAFEQPTYKVHENKVAHIREFADNAYLDCIKAVKNRK